MLARLAPPPTRSLGELLERMPARRRALAEVAWLLAALLGLGWVEAGLAGLKLSAGARQLCTYWAVALLVVAAYALVRPWQLARRGRPRLAVVFCVALAPVAVLTALGPVLRSGSQGPRIGVELADAPASGARAAALVHRVEPGSPADGRLLSGDLIVAVNGEPLARAAPANDLIERAASAERLPAGDARFTVFREGSERSVVVPLAPPAGAFGLREAFRATLLRDAALLAMLVALLVSDGQSLRELGLEPRHLAEELRAALPAFLGLMVAHFVLSLLVTAVALAVGGQILDAELGQRVQVTGALVAEHLGFTLPLIVFASATEELVFRGFMLPRLRIVAGSWTAALVLGALAFGLGHLYEGTLATVQTAGVGFFLGVIYLWRRRLAACIVAHVGFNALALVLALLVVSLGLLDQAERILQR